MFFVPGSGAKNNIVIGLIDVFGEWAAFLMSLLILWFWMHIFDRYYKQWWPKDVPQRAKAEMERRHTPDESEIELLGGK